MLKAATVPSTHPSADEYFEAAGVEAAVSAALRRALRERPQDPLGAIASYLQSQTSAPQSTQAVVAAAPHADAPNADAPDEIASARNIALSLNHSCDNITMARGLALKGAAAAEALNTVWREEGARKLVFGSAPAFRAGLEALIGLPHPKFMSAMEREHCSMNDSRTPFTTTNYKIETTSEIEARLLARSSPRSVEAAIERAGALRPACLPPATRRLPHDRDPHPHTACVLVPMRRSSSLSRWHRHSGTTSPTQRPQPSRA
jgi:hypothetical protein